MARRQQKKDVKNLQEQKKALTKIITIQLDQERKGQLEKLTTKIQYLATNLKYFVPGLFLVLQTPTAEGHISAFFTNFEKLQRASLEVICPKKFVQNSVDNPFNIQPPEAQSI